jgi:predicted Zn-dependent peptidase
VSLDNGLRGVLVPYDGSASPTTVRAVVRTGRSDAAPTEPGLARLAAQWLHHVSRRELAAVSDAHDASVGPDETVFTVETAPGRVPEAVRAVGRMLGRATDDLSASAAGFDSLRASVAQRLTQGAAHPETRARMRLETVLYDASTYGHPAVSPEQVSSYSLADVRHFLAERFGARRTAVYVVGTYDDAGVEEALRASLGDWASGSDDLYESVEVPPKHHLRVFDHPDADRTGIAVGAPVPGPGSDEYAALQVASRLIRQRRGGDGPSAYATAPHVMIDARRHASHWVATRQTPHAHAPATLTRLLARIDTLRTALPSAADLQQAQSALINRFMMQSSTPDGVAEQMAFLDRHGLGLEYFTTYPETIRRVSPQDVQRAVQTYLPRKRLTVVVSGPASRLRPHIKDAVAW